MTASFLRRIQFPCARGAARARPAEEADLPLGQTVAHPAPLIRTLEVGGGLPKPDYLFRAGVLIAASGLGSGKVADGPFGRRVSRDGASLKFTEADAAAWKRTFEDEAEDIPHYGGPAPFYTVLIHPTIAQVKQAVLDCHDFLDQFGSSATWGGGSLHFVFAGHGTTRGDLVLSDGKLSADDLMISLARRTPGSRIGRRLGVVLDSCYSGLTLARLITHEAHRREALLVDAFAAAMHDEMAWEVGDLGHGALTYAMTARRPLTIGGDSELALAIETQDEMAIRRIMYKVAPNPVSYLTQGDQHSLDLVNGHALEVKGLGALDILGSPSVQEICHALERLRESADPGPDNSITL